MATESAATVQTSPVRVFLLDDHELIRRAIRELLEVAEGIEVVGDSGSARSATTRILALRPDVALLDVRLADGSGIAVCRFVRQRDPSIRALMLTTFDDTEMRLGAALAGASGFVIKDIRVADLVDAIRRVAAVTR
jgi:two-component system, NarL family, response regulator DevR